MKPSSRKHLSALVLAGLAMLTACDRVQPSPAEPADEPFAFRTTSAVPVNVRILGPEGPLAGAVVTLRRSTDDPARPGDVLWTGSTDEDGYARGTPAFPLDQGAFTLIVTKRGFVGPYADEALRSQFGPVAPAAWVTASNEDLEATTLTFNRRER